MYRIHFEPKGAFWCIQFMKYNLFWETVTTITEGQEGIHPVKFESFAEAEKYGVMRGIDSAYDRRMTKDPSSAVAAGVANYPVPRGWRLVEG